MKKTEALRTARQYVSKPCGSGTSWRVYGPYRLNQIDGPTTESHFDGYRKARLAASVWVADIALYLMGETEAIDWTWLVAENDYATTAATILTAALARSKS